MTTLMSNHYHTLGYLRKGHELPSLMRKLHGSVAKLVNDALEGENELRHLPFWRETKGKEYFDGCIRDELQCRRAYRYTLTQSTRARLVTNWREYPHTHVNLSLERGVRRALKINAFMNDIPYPRYKR